MAHTVFHISLHCFSSELSLNTEFPVSGRTILFHISIDTTNASNNVHTQWLPAVLRQEVHPVCKKNLARAISKRLLWDTFRRGIWPDWSVLRKNRPVKQQHMVVMVDSRSSCISSGSRSSDSNLAQYSRHFKGNSKWLRMQCLLSVNGSVSRKHRDLRIDLDKTVCIDSTNICHRHSQGRTTMAHTGLPICLSLDYYLCQGSYHRSGVALAMRHRQ